MNSRFQVSGFRCQGAGDGKAGVRFCGRLPQNAKKILIRGNKPNGVLKAKGLAFSGRQNKLVFECKKRRSKRKNRLQVAEERVSGARFQVSGAGTGDGKTGARCRVSGVRRCE
jgi:hypothetical protein